MNDGIKKKIIYKQRAVLGEKKMIKQIRIRWIL